MWSLFNTICQIRFRLSETPQLRSPSHERSIRLIEEQFIHFPVRAEMELHPEALKLVDDEGSAVVGTEFVGWLAGNCHRELSIVVLPDNNSRGSLAECRCSADGRPDLLWRPPATV